jgi:sugar phosphate isomerase/epimerase
MEKIEVKIGFIGENRQGVIEDLKFAEKNKFNWYEIQGTDTKFEFSPGTIKEIRGILEKSNINLRLHIPFFLPISCSIFEVSKASLKFAKREILLAKKLNVKGITIHSGRIDHASRKEIFEKQMKILIKNLRELIKIANEYGIEIGLENSWRDSLVIKPSEILKIVKYVPGLKIVLDVGHANAAGLDPIKYFEKVRKYLSAVHIHDNKGNFDEHLSIGKGNIKFREFVKKCKELKFYGPFIIETFPKKNVLETRKAFLKFWNKT